MASCRVILPQNYHLSTVCQIVSRPVAATFPLLPNNRARGFRDGQVYRKTLVLRHSVTLLDTAQSAALWPAVRNASRNCTQPTMFTIIIPAAIQQQTLGRSAMNFPRGMSIDTLGRIFRRCFGFMAKAVRKGRLNQIGFGVAVVSPCVIVCHTKATTPTCQ